MYRVQVNSHEYQDVRTLVHAKKIKKTWAGYGKARILKIVKNKKNPSLAKTGKWIKARAVRIVGKTLQILK